MKVRTRFAPSPTGELHLGNARTAILNWLVARHEDGNFVVRFEDTDVERNVDTSEATILEGLDWLGLDRDEDPVIGGPVGPYRQSERGDTYERYADQLLSEGLAFRCFCLPEELEARRAAAMEQGMQPRYDGRCRDLSSARQQELAAQGRLSTIRFKVDPGPIEIEDRVRGAVTIDGA
jgi:glutamyl/glutaminyl-tRNA synthetase